MKETVSWRSISWAMMLPPIVVLLVILTSAWGAVRATTIATGISLHQHSALTVTGPTGSMVAAMMMPGGVVMPRGTVTPKKPPNGTTIRLHQKVVQVVIFNFAFKPARLVVSPGTRIIWTNNDSDPHTVDSMKNLWSSDALDTGNKFARVFAKVGAFTYYCSIHPFMHGEIIVRK